GFSSSRFCKRRTCPGPTLRRHFQLRVRSIDIQVWIACPNETGRRCVGKVGCQIVDQQTAAAPNISWYFEWINHAHGAQTGNVGNGPIKLAITEFLQGGSILDHYFATIVGYINKLR
uniref:Uncharacterized protein n=1 Tax=Romanomermis culicivorax TaxID=13658 RepID=A0A915HZJ7_ROMCU